MLDFTEKKYILLLQSLIRQGYHFQTFKEYLSGPLSKSIVLRHDVDKKPGNSLSLALIEHRLGLKGVYNFRARPVSWDENIIREINALGHEIGYHYENLAIFKGDFQKSYEDFKKNLEQLRTLVPVSTITMHGSPKSRFDSRDLWKKYNYRDLDILGEPYLDVDFANVLYLTDTGRRWDGSKVSIRDRVFPKMNNELTDKGFPIHSTNDLIKASEAGVLPDNIMINIHPQRWNRRFLPWFFELIIQNIKNIIKGVIMKLP